MGAVAELLPGALDLTDQDARAHMTRAWKEELPLAAGATLIEMIDRAQAGIIKGLFVIGENPVGSLPPQTGVKEALSKLDLLVCQELFLTETAALAHVVLPAASAMEKAGTFTNTEGHVQAVRPAIDPVGDSRPDWEILSALSVFIGAPLEYGDAKEILKEIRAVIPGYGSLGPMPIPPAVDSAAVDRYMNEGYRLGPCDSVYSARASPASGGNGPAGAGPELVSFREAVDPFEGIVADRTERVLADESRGCSSICHRHRGSSPSLEQRGRIYDHGESARSRARGLGVAPRSFCAGRHATL